MNLHGQEMQEYLKALGSKNKFLLFSEALGVFFFRFHTKDIYHNLCKKGCHAQECFIFNSPGLNSLVNISTGLIDLNPFLFCILLPAFLEVHPSLLKTNKLLSTKSPSSTSNMLENIEVKWKYTKTHFLNSCYANDDFFQTKLGTPMYLKTSPRCLLTSL